VNNAVMRHTSNWMLGCAVILSLPAHAQHDDGLADLINAFRASPQRCDGRRLGAAPALSPQRALSGIQIVSGTFLENTLKRTGYAAARASAISLSGATQASSVMAMLERKYCATLMDPALSAVGITRSGYDWLIILAQPAAAPAATRLPSLQEAGTRILAAVNTARASARQCGAAVYSAARALVWNPALGNAARTHSVDMARERYFNHRSKDGRLVGERASAAGYRWQRIGENIAVGQDSPEEVVNGWLDSPGHCANIMSDHYTDMGAAYAVNNDPETARIYWTQVFGTPRAEQR